MLNKKNKILISAIFSLFLLAIIIFAIKNKHMAKKRNNTIRGNFQEDILVENLKKIYPKFNTAQIEFYREIAKRDEDILIPCEGRLDENECIIAVAFIKGRSDICSHIEEQGERMRCANPILQKGIDKCLALDGNDFVNCLIAIFAIYDKQENCMNLEAEKIKELCESAFVYKKAYMRYNRNMCAEIKNDKLRTYCLKNIIDKSQDTDGDGLTDLDEINKYKTHYLYKDTDGDGISDYEEVRKAD